VEPAAGHIRPVAPRKVPSRSVPGERYRLDTFIVGESNRLAYNAGQQLAEGEHNTGAFGPLFIHGHCGVGKTHLLNAVAQRFKENHPGATVRVTGGEAFMNEYVAGVRAGDVEKFRRAFRRVDLLCIDDVHFLSNKQSTRASCCTRSMSWSGPGPESCSSPTSTRARSGSSPPPLSPALWRDGRGNPGARRRAPREVRADVRQAARPDAGALGGDMLVQRTGQLPGRSPRRSAISRGLSPESTPCIASSPITPIRPRGPARPSVR